MKTSTPEPVASANAKSHKRQGNERGILYLEYESSTPLGPRILAANEMVEKLTGYSRETLEGEPFGLIYDPDALDSFLGLLYTRIEHTDSFCWVERNLVKKGGQKETHYWTFAPIRNQRVSQERKGFVITLEPIGDPKHIDPESEPAAESREAEPASPRHEVPEPEPAKEKIETATSAEAEQATSLADEEQRRISHAIDTSRSESLSLVAGGIAHDLKNVLQTIKAHLEMARMCSNPSAATLTYISDSELALKDAENLARQMLAFTQGYESRIQETDLHEMLGHAVRISTMGSEVQCELSIAEGLPPVLADPKQIYQVFQNIIINGCQSMPSGGVMQVSAQKVSLAEKNKLNLVPGDYAAVGIRDRGCGIPEKYLKKIFEPDFTTKENGSGVGLASSQAIITNHGGRIAVDSTLNVGTEFIVFLPTTDHRTQREQSEADPSKKEPKPEQESVVQIQRHHTRSIPPSPPQSEGRKILVVDDQPKVRSVAERSLQFLGFDTLSASSGEEAIRLYQQNLDSHDLIDAILLDLTLPGGLGGREVKAEIHDMDPEAKVIATSGYFSDENPVEAFLNEGWCGVLEKPYSIEDLSRTIAEALKK